MHLSDFDFDLSPSLIARYPLPERSSSRLLCLDKTNGDIVHRNFIDLPQLLSPLDLLVFNNTRVIPARWMGAKESGGRIEMLIERMTDSHRALAHIRASKSPKPGSYLRLEGDVRVKVTGRSDDLFEILIEDERPLIALLQLYGHIPLPQYMGRVDETIDQERYQTIYAKCEGAVAAPTAGLHFDQQLLQSIRDKGVQTAFVTLHVGAGTFQPIRVENILHHQMHAEYLEVSEAVCHQVEETRQRGGRVIAVGTTTVRSLETAAQHGQIKPFYGDTRLFIYPGYRFQCVDAMITNFHLPQSSLLMLVCAFGGYEAVMNSYRVAMLEQYRFYSYGDAMFLAV